jgi:DNA-binding NarL/FixJ family response regulator
MKIEKAGITMSNKQKIRILLADDHAITRDGLRAMLTSEDDMQVVGEVCNGQEILEMVAKLLPDILLLDLVMPDMRPFEIEEWVRENHPKVVTLLVTGHHRQRFLAKAVAADVKGYLTKDQDARAFLDAIRRAAAGESALTGEQIYQAKCWQQTVGERWDSLTCQEREILRQVAAGDNNRQTADELGIALKTVESHITKIFRKLQVDSRAEAIAWARDHFLDGLPE